MRPAELCWLEAADPFPSPKKALLHPNGLLAAGGDLSTQRLLCAYKEGIFPWYEKGYPILWWCPDPRMVLFPQDFLISRSLKKSMRNKGFSFYLDGDFQGVIQACAAPRPNQQGTWITQEMQDAYMGLHRLGFAHSVEVRQEGKLVGGLYGVRLGGVFFGESMFSRISDASKCALWFLLERFSPRLVDCQVESEHLKSLGAKPISRKMFLEFLRDLIPGDRP